MKLAMLTDSLRSTFKPRLLWLAEFFGNPLIVVLALVWLQLPETGLGLTLTVALGVVIGVGFLSLAGATLAWFADHHAGQTPTLRGAFGNGLRHFWLLGVWGMAALAWCHVVEWSEGYRYQFPTYVRSELPMWLRVHVSEAQLLWVFLSVLAVAFWVAMPAIWLPPAAQLAARGFRGFGREGFRAWGRSLKRWQYWLAVALCAVIGVWLPTLLLGLRPMEPVTTPTVQASSLRWQMTSLVLRMFAAYVLALFAWMWVASATGRAATASAKADSK
jgi:hypothetical protein